MKLNDKQKCAVIIVILVLGIFGVGTLTFLKFRERGDLHKKLQDYLRQEQDAAVKIKRIPELREQRDRLASTVEEYADILPPEGHVQHDAFVNTIDSYRGSVVIRGAEYVPQAELRRDDAPVEGEKFIRHRYRFELLGTVPDFTAFVNKIENHTRFLKVDAFTIRPMGAPKNAGAMSPERELANADNEVKEIDVVVSTYTYKG